MQMKKIFFWLLGMVVCCQLSAQSKLIIVDDYWYGDVYEAQQNGLGLQKVAEFPKKNDTGYPINFFEYNGSYYGASDYYGENDNGTIFRYDYSSDSISILYNFVSDGATDLIAGPNNTLYGSTWNNELFSFDLATNTFTNLGSYGVSSSYQQLMLASNGKIYGVSRYSSNTNPGTIFELDPTSNAITILHTFDPSTDGYNFRRRLTEASDGLLYGAHRSGGANGNGTIFSIDPSDGSFAVRFNFDFSTSGRFPYSNLVQAPDGLLYGIQDNIPGGTGATDGLFAFDPTTDQYIAKPAIDENTFASNILQLTLIEGNIYGMGDDGGPNGNGMILKYEPNSGLLSEVFAFDGVFRWGEGTVLSGQGNKLMYTSTDGNYSDDGAIITIDTVTREAKLRAKFFNFPEGRDPDRAMTKTSNNRFFGIAEGGGNYNAGTIYEYLPNTRKIIGRFHFDVDSLRRYSRYLTEGSDGKLYGTTSYVPPSANENARINPLAAAIGGNNTATDARYIFSFNPETFQLDTILNFNNVEGNSPSDITSFTFDGDDMYGVVTRGGTNDWGGVFRYNVTSGQYDFLFSYDNTTGYGNTRVAVVDGVIYGMTNAGALNQRGAVYKYDIANEQLTILKDFGISELNESAYGFILHTGGKLYSELSRYPGGLLEVDPTTDAVTQKVAFADYNLRENDQGFISEGADGRIYGTVGRLSGSGKGLYAYDPDSNTFSDLFAPNYVQNVNNFQALAVCIAPLSEPLADTTFCANSSLSVGVNSSNTTSYVWKKDGVALTGQSTDSLKIDAVTAADAGEYTVVLENTCGSDSLSFVLTVSDIQLTSSTVNVSCHSGEDGSISVDASGGIAPYEYSLDGTTFQTEATFADLAAGDYTITVRDSIGCIASVVATISQPEALSLSTTGKDETCEKGFISVTPFGGVGPYEYSLDGTTYQESDMLKDVSAGEYTVYVRDANGCEVTESHTVDLVAALEVASTVTESTEYPENGSISLSVTGGAAPYTYAWNTGDSTVMISDIVPNDYSVTITDRNGCSVEESFTVGGVTSLADLQRQQGIHIYPNPVLDRLQVRLPKTTQVQSAQLYNPQGELIRSFSLKGGLNQLKAEGLKPGMYLLQLDSGVSTRIVIKK